MVMQVEVSAVSEVTCRAVREQKKSRRRPLQRRPFTVVANRRDNGIIALRSEWCNSQVSVFSLLSAFSVRNLDSSGGTPEFTRLFDALALTLRSRNLGCAYFDTPKHEPSHELHVLHTHTYVRAGKDKK